MKIEAFLQRAGRMKIEAFLQRAGRMAMDDTLVAFTRSSDRDGFQLWLDAGNRYVRTFISGLEVLQNQLDMTGFWSLQLLEPSCNPRCFKERIPDYDELHVGPPVDVVFKEGLWGTGQHPLSRVVPTLMATGFPAMPMVPESASKQLAPLDPPPPQLVGEWLTGAPAVAAMDKAGRQQLRMLVNEKLPTHLLGAPINSVKEALMGNAVEVTVAGGRDSYLLMAKELDDAGLTVTKAVALWR